MSQQRDPGQRPTDEVGIGRDPRNNIRRDNGSWGPVRGQQSRQRVRRNGRRIDYSRREYRSLGRALRIKEGLRFVPELLQPPEKLRRAELVPSGHV